MLRVDRLQEFCGLAVCVYTFDQKYLFLILLVFLIEGVHGVLESLYVQRFLTGSFHIIIVTLVVLYKGIAAKVAYKHAFNTLIAHKRTGPSLTRFACVVCPTH